MKQLQKTVVIFRAWIFLPLLCLLACVSAPYQAMSEAKQAFSSAENYLAQQNQIADIDQNDYRRAKTQIQDAERAINQGQYEKAETFLQDSKKHSQAILKRHQANQQEPVKFRY